MESHVKSPAVSIVVLAVTVGSFASCAPSEKLGGADGGSDAARNDATAIKEPPDAGSIIVATPADASHVTSGDGAVQGVDGGAATAHILFDPSTIDFLAAAATTFGGDS